MAEDILGKLSDQDRDEIDFLESKLKHTNLKEKREFVEKYSGTIEKYAQYSPLLREALSDKDVQNEHNQGLEMKKSQEELINENKQLRQQLINKENIIMSSKAGEGIDLQQEQKDNIHFLETAKIKDLKARREFIQKHAIEIEKYAPYSPALKQIVDDNDKQLESMSKEEIIKENMLLRKQIKEREENQKKQQHSKGSEETYEKSEEQLNDINQDQSSSRYSLKGIWKGIKGYVSSHAKGNFGKTLENTKPVGRIEQLKSSLINRKNKVAEKFVSQVKNLGGKIFQGGLNNQDKINQEKIMREMKEQGIEFSIIKMQQADIALDDKEEGTQALLFKHKSKQLEEVKKVDKNIGSTDIANYEAYYAILKDNNSKIRFEKFYSDISQSDLNSGNKDSKHLLAALNNKDVMRKVREEQNNVMGTLGKGIDGKPAIFFGEKDEAVATGIKHFMEESQKGQRNKDASMGLDK